MKENKFNSEAISRLKQCYKKKRCTKENFPNWIMKENVFIILWLWLNIGSTYIYIYNSAVRVYFTDFLLNGWTELNDFFCTHLDGASDGLDSKISAADGVAIGI